MKKYWSLILLSLLLFIIDRVTKYLIIKIPSEGIFFSKNIGLKLYQNPGLAFSLPLPNILNIFLTALIVVGLIYFLIKFLKRNLTYFFLPISLILIGSISNLMDRVQGGGVIDFISIYLWPAFNLADCYIVIGIVLLFFSFKRYSSARASKTVTGDSETKQDFSK